MTIYMYVTGYSDAKIYDPAEFIHVHFAEHPGSPEGNGQTTGQDIRRSNLPDYPVGKKFQF